MIRATRYTTLVQSLMAIDLPSALPPMVMPEIPLQLGHDHRRRRAGDDAADVAHHVVAHGTDLVGVLQKPDSLPSALFLVGGHGVERLGVRRRHRHAHHVEDDAQRDKHRQYQQRYHVTCALQRRGGEKAHNGTERYRQQEYPQRPAALLFAFLFILTVTVCQVTNLAFLIKFFIWIE